MKPTWSVILGSVEGSSHCVDQIVGEFVDLWIIWKRHFGVVVLIASGG